MPNACKGPNHDILSTLHGRAVWCIILCGMLTGCSDRGPLARYYFQEKNLGQGLVFQYASVSKQKMPDQFWYLKSVEQDGAYYIQGNVYDQYGNLQQFYEERINSSGVTAEEFHLVTADTVTGRDKVTRAEIMHDDIFPFDAQKGGIFLFNINWTYADDPATRNELIRNRIFAGDTTVVFEGDEYPAIQFRVRDRIEHTNEGTLGINTFGAEIYAKGIGLVAYQKKFETGEQIAYQLKKIYKTDEFRKQFGLDFDMESH